ncbi:putative peptide chain release factor C12orf65, mitochondrial [Vanrija pseudolonga]|uniref:Peptide chain release factor C12orf65, mitochondrial n=1 Tax=Vanrija pseudolonga TaxID=143232 RepID=A0AAF1BJW8_9TREE|nr:putative peptide chain release factor C12orf65, mitochondrial [Vanrija pseudolonga]
MSLRPLFCIAARSVRVSAQSTPRLHRPPAVGCSYWRSTPRAYATKPSSQESAGFLDEVEVDEAWDDELNLGDEVEEGVFVSVVVPEPAPAAGRTPNPRSIKHLNRLLSRHEVPDLLESELEEKFVRGRGPGGQAINKTNSSVCLTHLPTGLRVQAQPTRSREENRAVARKILKERLDLMRRRGELDGVHTASAAGGGKGEAVKEDASRKERLAAEARASSKAELRWEKERRRKLNRAKKVKRREGRGKEGEGGEAST